MTAYIDWNLLDEHKPLAITAQAYFFCDIRSSMFPAAASLNTVLFGASLVMNGMPLSNSSAKHSFPKNILHQELHGVQILHTAQVHLQLLSGWKRQ